MEKREKERREWMLRLQEERQKKAEQKRIETEKKIELAKKNAQETLEK